MVWEPYFEGGLGHNIYKGEAKWENAELNKENIGAKLKQVQQHIHDWPSLYQRKNHTDEPIAVEYILGQLDGIVDIIGYYLSQLPYANDHNISNFNREGGQKFDKKESLKLFKKGDNLPRYKLFYFCSSNNLQWMIDKPFFKNSIHSKISE